MEIAIVKFFQDLANGFFDAFFWFITKLGEETVFLMVLAFVYVCYSKKFAVKLSMYYLVSVGFNSVMKLIVRRPRPYIASSEIVDRLHTNGYSFPSGHSAVSLSFYGFIGYLVYKSNLVKWKKVLFICLLFMLC